MIRYSILALAVAASACASAGGRYDPAGDLAALDRALSAEAERVGFDAALTPRLSYDAVIFRPGPVNALEHMRANPSPANQIVRWEPLYAETSADQKIGWTTGTFQAGERGSAALQSGNYITVWHREGPDWRIMLDAGVIGPGAGGAAEPLRTKTGSNRFRVDQMLYAIDDSLNSAHQERLAIHGADELRLYRAGAAPTRSREAALALAARSPVTDWSRTKLHIPLSGDFAYAYGSAAANGQPAGWVRIYRKTNMSRWQLIAEMVQPSNH